MNITPNYQLKAFNLRMDKPQIQTNPNFGMAEKIAAGAEKVIPAATAVLAGTVIAVQNGKTKEGGPVEPQEFPTKEEFETMLNNSNVEKYTKDYWLKAYDLDAKNTIAFFNLEDKEGNKYRETCYVSTFNNNIKSELPLCYQHPELVKQVVDTEDEHSLRIFSFPAAETIVRETVQYPEGLTKMLSMKDEYGNMRFSKTDDYVAAGVFEKYPEEAEKYAGLKDETGNFRFGGREIDEIVKATMLNQEITKDPDNHSGIYHYGVDTINSIVNAKAKGSLKPEDIDNILNLRRSDGSFVFNGLPCYTNIMLYVKDPELFSEICNIRIPDRSGWFDSEYIPQLIDSYRQYPQETKHLLQMAGKNKFEPRFMEHEIIDTWNDAQKLYKYAPKTFRSLAQMKKGDYVNDGYRFSLSEICRIMNKLGKDEQGNISEFSKEDLKAVFDLSKMQLRKGRISGDYSYLCDDSIINAFSTYKKYPKEFKEIMLLLEKTDKYRGYTPDEEDILLYINDRAEFDKKYIM